MPFALRNSKKFPLILPLIKANISK